MKYIHIVQFHLMSGGGVGSVLTDLCEAMAKQSSEVYILSLFQREGIEFEDERMWASEHGINVRIIQRDGMSKSTVMVELRKYIKQLLQDDECTLFLHLKWGVLAGIVSTLGLKRIKRIEVYHSGYMNYKLQAGLCKRFIDYYIAVSEEAKSQLMKWFRIKENKISVIYNGVNVNYIKSFRKNSTVKDHLIRVVSIGRLSFEKGFLYPIKGFVQFQNKRNISEMTYKVIGTGNQLKDAQEIAGEKIVFTGVISREHVFEEISLSDIVIMPSLWEGNSILLLETLAVGKALAVTDIPSFREVLNFSPLSDNEIIREEKFGYVFKKENVEACELVFQSIYNNRGKLSEMSNYAGQLADNYSTSIQADKYMRIFKNLK